MNNARMPRWIISFSAVLGVASFCGCGEQSYQVGEVEGIVFINGTPAGNIFVQFIPEVSGEASPPPSNAQTDEQGYFVLNMIEPSGSMQPGAAVGTHRVVLRDLQATASPGAVAPRVRLPVQVTMPGSTPMTQEVKEGKQTVEIHVPPR